MAREATDAIGMERVVEICSRLIRFDTTNFGGGASNGESDAARFVAETLNSAGYEPLMLGRTDERQNVVVRVPGRDRSLPALLVHAHLDVVPAEPDQWSVDPFGGTISDGYLWGRGAVDMKDMVATTLETLIRWSENGVQPRRDMVVAFVADEEDKGEFGAQWLADEHPELFSGVEAAISESGGAATELTAADGGAKRLYSVATAERGTMHMRLTATGRSGHGSRPSNEIATTALVMALHRIVTHAWPLHLSEPVRGYLQGVADAMGISVDLTTEAGILACVDAVGSAGELPRFTLRASATPTILKAGYKVNVIPGIAHAELDVRTPPGYQDDLLQVIDELLGDAVTREFTAFQLPVESQADSPWFDAMAAAIRRRDPDAVVVPYCMGGGTDAKAFTPLGIQCYGFAPLGLDPDGRRPSGAHGVDERVPVASLIEGQRILESFLTEV